MPMIRNNVFTTFLTYICSCIAVQYAEDGCHVELHSSGWDDTRQGSVVRVNGATWLNTTRDTGYAQGITIMGLTRDKNCTALGAGNFNTHEFAGSNTYMAEYIERFPSGTSVVFGVSSGDAYSSLTSVGYDALASIGVNIAGRFGSRWKLAFVAIVGSPESAIVRIGVNGSDNVVLSFTVTATNLIAEELATVGLQPTSVATSDIGVEELASSMTTAVSTRSSTSVVVTPNGSGCHVEAKTSGSNDPQQFGSVRVNGITRLMTSQPGISLVAMTTDGNCTDRGSGSFNTYERSDASVSMAMYLLSLSNGTAVIGVFVVNATRNLTSVGYSALADIGINVTGRFVGRSQLAFAAVVSSPSVAVVRTADGEEGVELSATITESRIFDDALNTATPAMSTAARENECGCLAELRSSGWNDTKQGSLIRVNGITLLDTLQATGYAQGVSIIGMARDENCTGKGWANFNTYEYPAASDYLADYVTQNFPTGTALLGVTAGDAYMRLTSVGYDALAVIGVNITGRFGYGWKLAFVAVVGSPESAVVRIGESGGENVALDVAVTATTPITTGGSCAGHKLIAGSGCHRAAAGRMPSIIASLLAYAAALLVGQNILTIYT